MTTAICLIESTFFLHAITKGRWRLFIWHMFDIILNLIFMFIINEFVR